MHIKFRITFEDDSIAESHDEMYNWLYDHAHFLPPNLNKRWKKYSLISDEGHDITVNFHTGIFRIKDKDKSIIEIKVFDKDGSELSNRKEKQNFTDTTNQWMILNGLEYFPVVGRRYIKGDWGEAMSYFCGWKIDKGEGQSNAKEKQKRIVQYIYHLMPDGTIFLEKSL